MEEVGVEPKMGVELGEQSQLVIIVVAVIADGPTDDGVVFLFNVAAIVLAEGTAAGKGDSFSLTIPEQFIVNELTAVIGVNAQQREGDIGPDLLESPKHMVLGFVPHSTCFGPS